MTPNLHFRKSMDDKAEGEDEELAEAIAKSSSERERLEAQKADQELLLAEHFKTKVSIADPSVVMGPASTSTPSGISDTGEVSADELERRKAFLRAQRDKLLAMKKEEREKQLQVTII